MSNKPKAARRLPEARFRPGGYIINCWEIEVEHGTSLDEVITPIFWTHVAKHLSMFDEIKVISESRDIYIRLLVVGCDRLSARVHVLEHHDLSETPKFMPSAGLPKEDDFFVEYAGKVGKWRFCYKDTKRPVKDKFETREEAESGLKEHLKILVA